MFLRGGYQADRRELRQEMGNTFSAEPFYGEVTRWPRNVACICRRCSHQMSGNGLPAGIDNSTRDGAPIRDSMLSTLARTVHTGNCSCGEVSQGLLDESVGDDLEPLAFTCDSEQNKHSPNMKRTVEGEPLSAPTKSTGAVEHRTGKWH